MTYIISAVVSAILLVTALNVPAHIFSVKNLFPNQIFGAFTQITSTDNLADFPTTYNANLNKTIEVGTTSVASITTLANLSTLGTITSGIWNGTVIGVAYNGTGTTSPTLNQVMLGNSSSGFKVVSGFGNSGQFLTSGGAATPPTWTTSAIDQAANYTWTGHHIFSSLFATAASSTNATTTNMWVTGLGTAAGTLVAANPLGQLIATSTPVSSYVGTTIATSSSAVSVTYSSDYTYTTPFQPTTIILHIKGLGRDSSGAVKYTIGTNLFSGTSCVSGLIMKNNETADTMLPSGTTVGCSLQAGDSATNWSQMTVSIPSITATSFTVRVSYSSGITGGSSSMNIAPVANR
jgi:hypothetical protein